MKKIISLFLVFIFSFTLISSARQKETKAVAIVAGYTISQILGAMALSATVVGAGYAVTDTLVNPDDNSEFTDFLQTVFKQTLDLHKYEIPPPPEPLKPLESAALLSLLTEQGIKVTKDMYNHVFDYYIQSMPDLPPGVLPGQALIAYAGPTFRQLFVTIEPDTKIYKSGDYYYSTKNIRRYESFNGADWNRDTVLSITSGLFSDLYLGWEGDIPIYTDNTFTTLVDSPTFGVDIPDILQSPDNLVEPENFTDIFKNVDMSPLNGLVKSPQELIDIINGVKKVPAYVYGKITTAFNDIYNNFLENPNFIGADSPLTPTIEPTTGTLYFGDPKIEEPEIDTDPLPDELSALNKALFWLKGIWQSIRDLPKNIAIEIGNIFQYLKNFIERFWQSFTEWWKNNFLYHWTLFIDWLHTLPNLIANALTPLFDTLMIPVNGLVSILQNIWDWLQGFPDMLVGLIVPPDNEIAEVWEPVSDLFNQKIFPVIQPFQNIGFYEEELQDISADIKIGQYQGNHKIIDYSYLKSVREPIKSVIRSFFWILIIFFNLDQVHRLIRNQSIVKTYIRKVDEPGGNK